MLKESSIFIGLKYSNLVSDLYGLMRRILYLISVAPYCRIIVTLAKHCVIKKMPLYGVSYFYAVRLFRMTLYPTL